MLSGNEERKLELGCGHGTTLCDYSVVVPIGAGSLGRVFEVKCKQCGKGFALKVLEIANIQQRGLIMKLINEVKIHLKLKNKRIVELYQYFEDNECAYLLLELCKNGDLSTFINSRGPLPEAEALWIFKQIVEGVKYLHDMQVMHRDLKPTNILLTEQGDIKIADFGVATQLKELSEEHNTMCGTANYISPEIASNLPHGIETDIWSLGCILYALILGKPPFESSNTKDTLKRVREGDFVLPEGVSEEVHKLLRATMNFNPKERISIGQILAFPCVINATSNYPRINNISSFKEHTKHLPIEKNESTRPTEEKVMRKIAVLESNPKYAKIVRQPDIKENIQTHNTKLQPDFTMCLNTERLKPITHVTPYGYIKVDEKLYVEMEIDSKTKIMRISPNGRKILLYSKLVADCNMEYNLCNLPNRLRSAYKYAFDFVNVLRSKTPKIIYKCIEYKFCLMENEPYHSCELYMQNGTRAVHTIGHPKVDVYTFDGRKIRIDHMQDYDYLSPEIQHVIDCLFESLRKSVEVEDLAKFKGAHIRFPITIGPETDKNYFNTY